jgi:hypothetical protein
MRIAFCCNTRRDKGEFQVEYEPEHTIKLVKHAIEAAGWEYLQIEADETCFEKLHRETDSSSIELKVSVERQGEPGTGLLRDAGIPTRGGIMATPSVSDKPNTKNT